MKDPFSIELRGQKDIRHRTVQGFHEERNEGDSAPWLVPGHRDTHARADSGRLRPLLVFIVALFLALTVRVGFLQLVDGNRYRVWAEENRIRIRDVKAPRGTITDVHGIDLVRNVPTTAVTATSADIPSGPQERDALVQRLAGILGADPTEIAGKLSKLPPGSYEPVTIVDKVTHEQSLLIEVESNQLPGIQIETASSREYIYDAIYAHVLGYVGKLSQDEYDRAKESEAPYALNDVIGKTGIELTYENFLRGQSGKKEIEVDARGRESKIVAETKPVHGNNLTLSIDHDLQSTLFSAVQKAVDAHHLRGGAAVALDPRSGEVRALVSVPSFSANEFVTGISQENYQNLQQSPRLPLFFRAISGEYPSGSVIKPVIAAAALQEHVVTPSTTFVSTGGIRIGDWFFPDWKAGGHGVTDIRKALAESVNTFFYYIGGGDNETFTGLGVDRIRKYAELFGLNAVLGIDLPGEAAGFLPSKSWKESSKGEPWYIGDTYHLSIGQGDLLVTPLQVASYTATVANGGTLYRPHVVQKIVSADGTLIKQIQPDRIRDQVVESQYLQVVREGMRQAVLSGSARQLHSLPISSAAKTGTAQFGDKGQTHAWFTVFFPYEAPQVALTIILEGGGEGSETALPVARDVMQWWADNRQ